MNLHPLLVHFPVALLSLYALIELVRVRRLLNAEWWFNLKASLIIVGTAFGYLAASFGEVAEHEVVRTARQHQVVELHSSFAVAVLVVATLLAIAYLVTLITRYDSFINHLMGRGTLTRYFNMLKRCTAFTMQPWVYVTLAALLIVLLTITGALGSVISHGPDTDFIVAFVYQLFFP